MQAIVLLPAYATAVGLDAGMARSWAGLRKLWPAVAGFGGLALAWLVWQLASGGATLGGYQVVADTSYSVGGSGEVRRLPPRRPADPLRRASRRSASRR